MPLSSTYQNIWSDLVIPDDVVRGCKKLERFIHSGDSDETLEEWLPNVWLTVSDSLKTNEYLKGLVATRELFEEDIRRRGKGKFYELLRDGANRQDWRGLLKNDVFFTESLSTSVTPSRDTLILNESWNATFRGNAADVLLMTISTYLDKQRSVYARCTSIVNSSGTGKSRMVDQVATKIITIPMCLRGEGTKGFPPADAVLRAWLSALKYSGDQIVVAKKLHGFISSLFSVTSKRLKVISSLFPVTSERLKVVLLELQSPGAADMPELPRLTKEDIRKLPDSKRYYLVSLSKRRQEILAAAFRERMTRGQSFEVPNEYRREFFREVIDAADEFARENAASPRDMQYDACVLEAAKELAQFVDPAGLLDSDAGPRRPLVILAFDEGHMLTNIPMGQGSLFSKLCRALQIIVELPIFSLFLSTAAKFRLFSPEIQSDSSGRVVDLDLPLLHPISETSFDDLAFPAYEGTVTLDKVTENQWISHLGRPLFGSRYEGVVGGEEEAGGYHIHDLMHFAKAKLLDGPTTLKDVGGPGSLACLSVRFALDIGLAYGYCLEVAHTQIERHMRLCVAATAGFEKSITIAGSEPFLAEAARDLMSYDGAVRHLAENSSLSCVGHGQRGELVAALIVMRARDASAGVCSKVVHVNEFMKALLPESAYKELKFTKPQFWRSGEDKPFYEAFEGYSTWFNHVIKIQQSDMISTEHLWKFITRGAMVMCVDSQVGIDIVLPICARKQKLSRQTVSAILIQVKNNKTFKCKVDKTLFDSMDPFRVGLFSEGDEPLLPVIRLVFALESDKAGVMFPVVTEHKHHFDRFTAYDIWCAGLSPDIFQDIGSDLKWYKSLLLRSLQPHDAFDLKQAEDNYQDEATALARGAKRRRMAPLSVPVAAHDYIHDPMNFPDPEDAMDQGD